MKKFIVIVFLLFIPSQVFAFNLQRNLAEISKKIQGEVVDLQIDNERNLAFFLTRRNIYIYEFKAKKKIAVYDFGVSEIPLRLDLIDLDNDKQKEIVITSVLSALPSSYVFKLIPNANGFALKTICKSIAYFFRSVVEEKKSVLLVQASTDVNPFAGSVFRAHLEGKKIKKREEIDLPKNTGIYQFAFAEEVMQGQVWVRNDSGFLVKYEKKGKKWKKSFKSSERYSGGVNCYRIRKSLPMTETTLSPVCAPKPPLIFASREKNSEKEGESKLYEKIVIDGHDFFVAGVMLDPKKPSKTFLHFLRFSDDYGMDECARFGPYQGWVEPVYYNVVSDGSVKIIKTITEDAEGDTEEKKEYLSGFGKGKVFLIKNTINKYTRGPRIEEIDISSIDCREEM